MPASDVVLIYTTWPNEDTAAAAGERLVAMKLIACANVMAPATAMYMWEGKPERGTEVPMLIKTGARHVEAVTSEIKKMHPYDVPAVVAVEINGGNAEFLDWVDSQTAS